MYKTFTFSTAAAATIGYHGMSLIEPQASIIPTASIFLELVIYSVPKSVNRSKSVCPRHTTMTLLV